MAKRSVKKATVREKSKWKPFRRGWLVNESRDMVQHVPTGEVFQIFQEPLNYWLPLNRHAIWIDSGKIALQWHFNLNEEEKLQKINQLRARAIAIYNAYVEKQASLKTSSDEIPF